MSKLNAILRNAARGYIAQYVEAHINEIADNVAEKYFDDEVEEIDEIIEEHLKDMIGDALRGDDIRKEVEDALSNI